MDTHQLSATFSLSNDMEVAHCILLASSMSRLAKLDFGEEQGCRTICGTPAYMAPEMVRGEAQGFGVDWWALGVVLYQREL